MCLLGGSESSLLGSILIVTERMRTREVKNLFVLNWEWWLWDLALRNCSELQGYVSIPDTLIFFSWGLPRGECCSKRLIYWLTELAPLSILITDVSQEHRAISGAKELLNKYLMNKRILLQIP